MAKQKETANRAPSTVTIIIPMYNAEKYIEQCLNSLVAQTSQDFDVIVVDDCSTDNSVNLVRNFIPQFQGRLRLKSLSKNSGNSGVPKNTAIQMARSKYLTFLDSDDYFGATAIEELIKIAELTDADVIHSSHYFTFEDGKNNITTSTFQQKYFVDRPMIETQDIGERVKKFTERGFLWWGQNKIYKREFLLKNKINFPPVSVWEDLVFSFMCVVCAEKYVRIPNIFYFYRYRKESLSHKANDPFDMIQTLMNVIKALDDFMDRIEFFKQNPQFRYMFFDWHIQARLNILCKFFYVDNNFQPFLIDKLFRQKFSSANLQECLGFMSYFYTATTYQKFLLSNMSGENAALKKKISELEMDLAKYKVNSFVK